MALKISVSLDNKPLHFQLASEKFNWNNLVTILELSSPQASSNQDTLVLYYRHPTTGQVGSISNQNELDTLMADLKTPCDRLFFDTDSSPAESLVGSNSFEKLSQIVSQNQPLGRHASLCVGFLASHIASSSDTNFDRELNWLNEMASKRTRNKRKHGLQHKEGETSSSESEDEHDGFHKRMARGHRRGHHGGRRDRHGRHPDGPFGRHGSPFDGPFDGSFGGPFGEKFNGPFGKHGKHFGGPWGKHGPHGKPFGGPCGKYGPFGRPEKPFDGPFGEHFDERFDESFDESLDGPSDKRKRHFGGPFGKHRRHFGGPFGKHGRHFGGPFGNHFGPFGKHRQPFGGRGYGPYFGPERSLDEPFTQSD